MAPGSRKSKRSQKIVTTVILPILPLQKAFEATKQQLALLRIHGWEMSQELQERMLLNTVEIQVYLWQEAHSQLQLLST